MPLRGSELKTLRDWLVVAQDMFGAESRPVAYLQQKITEQGPDAPVIADATQILRALVALHGKREA